MFRVWRKVNGNNNRRDLVIEFRHCEGVLCLCLSKGQLESSFDKILRIGGLGYLKQPHYSC